ncbi:hypothetical protein ABRT01_11250 [Lentibacillus sp. L22]|uniref:hypothetical protein n=1 Tax=Lentibacillus sp. L22 TaxID=3163028 RepID=UPI0034670D5D
MALSTNDAFQSEKFQMDNLLEKGYIISDSKGTLDGDLVEFMHKTTFDKKTILLTNPDSRKYFAILCIKQQKQAAE